MGKQKLLALGAVAAEGAARYGVLLVAAEVSKYVPGGQAVPKGVVRRVVPARMNGREICQLAAASAADPLVNQHWIHGLHRLAHPALQGGETVPPALGVKKRQVEVSVEHHQCGAIDDVLGDRSRYLVDGVTGIASLTKHRFIV